MGKMASSRRVLVASLIGSAIEWFDYFLYGTLASLVFGRAFFPSEDPTVGVLLAYLTFALTFVVRPFGGIVFAHIGDRLGRKTALVMTLSMMGLGTALIGVLPTYETVGLAAPLALVALRIVQGIGIGGEWGGALLLAYEHAPEDRKGLFGSIPQTGVTLGMLLATICVALVSLLPEKDFQTWGWRLPFAVSAVSVAIGLWLRREIDETPDFTAAPPESSEPLPLLSVLRDNWREVLVAICAKCVETAPFYIFTVLLIGYATEKLGLGRLTALNAVTLGALIASIAIPCYGALADRFSRKSVFLLGSAALGLFAVPYFMLLDLRSVAGLLGATVVGFGLIWPAVTAVLGTMMSDMFPPRIRFTGITLGYQIGAALVGGTAPMAATLLLRMDGGNWRFVALYIIGSAAVSFGAVIGWLRFAHATPPREPVVANKVHSAETGRRERHGSVLANPQ